MVRSASRKLPALSASVLATWLLLLGGCSKDNTLKLGLDIPEDAQTATLDDVLANPKAYNGKSILIEGTISGQCGSLCHIYVQDGKQSAKVFPEGYKFPKFTKGSKVAVFSQVTSGPETVVFSALGTEVSKGSPQ